MKLETLFKLKKNQFLEKYSTATVQYRYLVHDSFILYTLDTLDVYLIATSSFSISFALIIKSDLFCE